MVVAGSFLVSFFESFSFSDTNAISPSVAFEVGAIAALFILLASTASSLRSFVLTDNTLSVQSSFCLLSRFWHILELEYPSTCLRVYTICGTLSVNCLKTTTVCEYTLFIEYNSVKFVGVVSCGVRSLYVNRLLGVLVCV